MSDPKYASVFDELRHTHVFCDAVLKVHKVILSSSSSYFRAMFELWSAHDDRDFTLDGISPKIMSLVLEWIYTESITLSRKTILDLLLAAHMLRLEKLKKICFQFLEDNVCPENCIGLWKISNVVSTKIRDLARRFILNHFEEVVPCDEFQQLTAQELISFIEDDELNVKNETAVYQAILHWTNHDLQQRRAEFPYMLTKLQPQEISPPPTANLDRSNDKVYENVTGLVKAVIEMSNRIQPAAPEEYVPMVKEVGLALRTLLATVDETMPVLPASTHREIEMAQKLLNSDLAELISKMKLAQQYVMTSLQKDYKKQMLMAAHALAVDAKNLLDVIDQSRLKMISQPRPY